MYINTSKFVLIKSVLIKSFAGNQHLKNERSVVFINSCSSKMCQFFQYFGIGINSITKSSHLVRYLKHPSHCFISQYYLINCILSI